MSKDGAGRKGVKSDAVKLLARLKERLQAGDPEGAAQAYARYLEVEPRDLRAWTDRAGLLLALQRPEEARQACQRALALDPGHLPAQYHLGCAELKLGLVDQAEARLNKILSVEPERADVQLSLVKCLLHKRDLDAAQAALEDVLRQDPGNVSAHQFLGQIFYERGQWPEFEAELERFRRCQPTSRYADFEEGFKNLLHGVMPLGWQQWEARLQVPGCVGPERNFSQPRWAGESFVGKTLLLHYEQGLGDTLMLVRFLPWVKALGGRVLLLVQPSLAHLMTTCQGPDQVLAQGEPLPPFDLHASLYSLPAIFQTDLASIPQEIPYLGIPERVPNREAILDAIRSSGDLVRVGIVWAGYSGHPRDAQRSLPIDLVHLLAEVPGVAWYGFQLEASAEPNLPNYVPLAPLLSDFSDTAYALSGMDLVITVDTALAHLAGAMGVPTLLLVTFVPDFRWLLERGDSPWYPTMQIFRQPSHGDWNAVINAVIGALTG